MSKAKTCFSGGQGVHVLLILLASSLATSSASNVLINEVAYKGSTVGSCDGEDWVELFNNDSSSSTPTSLDNYILHDDKGPADDKAYIFPTGVSIAPGEYKVLCKGADFAFGIGSTDTVTLVDTNGAIVSTSGSLPGTGGDSASYALFDPASTGEIGNEAGYEYTSTPTPGEANVITAIEQISREERLEAQNTLGRDFFKMNDDGSRRTSSPFADVVDIYLDVETTDLEYLKTFPGHETYVPFTQVRVVNEGKEVEKLVYGGRIRTKGFRSLMVARCLGASDLPHLIDFNRVNSTQTLFGVERGYFRSHFGDYSCMREHASHRLNARFGLPFLRTRHVRLYLNSGYIGFYTFTEAPELDYVMHRSFGAFDPAETALYKFKIIAASCGDYTSEELETAKQSPVPDPYYFKRGPHRDTIPVEYGNAEFCSNWFIGQYFKDRMDAVKGYVEYNEDCGEAMVELGLVDRDYGSETTEASAKAFLNDHIYAEDNSGLPDAIDIDQWLKNFAVYAVMLNMDSPIDNLNNWYIATTSNGNNDWRIVQWDHNTILSRNSLCSSKCDLRLIYTPILSPSCTTAMEDHPLLGPILSNNDENLRKYVEYVEEFNSLLTDDFFQELYDLGDSIKQFVEYPQLTAETADYESSELSTEIEGYNTIYSPFIRILRARKEQVEQQIKEFKAGTLPRDGIYGNSQVEQCPDWRDPNGMNYVAEDYLDESCSFAAFCGEAQPCFVSGLGCSSDGKFLIPECEQASLCGTCFPFSPCGTFEDKSDEFVASTKKSECKEGGGCEIDAGVCFSETAGHCAFDGEMITEECKAKTSCSACYPQSRCGSITLSPDTPDIPIDDPTNSGRSILPSLIQSYFIILSTTFLVISYIG
uniref:LTD domain-containing protein n=1 Tax=Chaetoceros debilis TaxID=122233 RepID=A0A6S8YZZ2_9STRA